MKTTLRKSECLDDWYVIEPHHGTGQPEGTGTEWWQILEAMKKRAQVTCSLNDYRPANGMSDQSQDVFTGVVI